MSIEGALGRRKGSRLRIDLTRRALRIGLRRPRFHQIGTRAQPERQQPAVVSSWRSGASRSTTLMVRQ
jgi:hypothetical protein